MYPYYSELRSYEQELLMKAAADRDNRLNKEEQRVQYDTLMDLEWGVGFLGRAHP
jgi:hypothetical protein